MYGATKGTSTSLLLGLFSEKTLHGLTFLGIVVTMLGFLYLSYELLGRPRGILNWLLILFTHLAVGILILLVVAPPMLFLFEETLKATHIPSNIVDPIEQTGDIIIYTLMIGTLQGTLIAFPPLRTVKRTLWRDCLIGFIFALIFFSIDEYLIFHTPINDVIDVIPDFLLFALMGVGGAGFWRRYGQSSHYASEITLGKDEPRHPLFSFADFIRGLLFWYIVVGLSTILWIVLYIRWYGLTGDILFYLVDLFIGAAPASLTCGSSQYITWKVDHLGEKQLGVIGAILTMLGFLLNLIEPLVLFLTTSNSHAV